MVRRNCKDAEPHPMASLCVAFQVTWDEQGLLKTPTLCMETAPMQPWPNNSAATLIRAAFDKGLRWMDEAEQSMAVAKTAET